MSILGQSTGRAADLPKSIDDSRLDSSGSNETE